MLFRQGSTDGGGAARLSVMRIALATVFTAATLVGCSWLLAHDPPVPVNANTYVTCANGIQCLADGQECPLTGDRCIDVLPSTCSIPPCAMAKLRDGGVLRDAGIGQASGLLDAASSDARADR